ncbi:hypothetical protein LZC95_16340 [Pendulispora brunnea]|uniref:Uncharacterized protein n=1 Tax=Pendulispora brunnea TaxID=2905690 RepID=A0ABZ2KM42_9BACT
MKMPFRDDLSALETRRATLERELSEIRERKRELTGLEEREKQLERQLQEARAVLADMPGASPPVPSLLDNVRVASPCDAPWDEMEGNGRVRFCLRCERNVYNLSAMPREEAEELLRSRGDLCIRLYRREDETILTSDCPVGLQMRRSQRRRLALVALGGGLLATGAGAFAAAESQGEMQLPLEPIPETQVLQGGMLPPPTFTLTDDPNADEVAPTHPNGKGSGRPPILMGRPRPHTGK